MKGHTELGDDVLDASAVLVLLNAVSGAERVEAGLEEGTCLSTLQMAKITATLAPRGLSAYTLRQIFIYFNAHRSALDEKVARPTGLFSPDAVGTAFFWSSDLSYLRQ